MPECPRTPDPGSQKHQKKKSGNPPVRDGEEGAHFGALGDLHDGRHELPQEAVAAQEPGEPVLDEVDDQALDVGPVEILAGIKEGLDLVAAGKRLCQMPPLHLDDISAGMHHF